MFTVLVFFLYVAPHLFTALLYVPSLFLILSLSISFLVILLLFSPFSILSHFPPTPAVSPCHSPAPRHQQPFRGPLCSFSFAVYYCCDSSQTPHSCRDVISSWYELILLASRTAGGERTCGSCFQFIMSCTIQTHGSQCSAEHHRIHLTDIMLIETSLIHLWKAPLGELSHKRRHRRLEKRLCVSAQLWACIQAAYENLKVPKCKQKNFIHVPQKCRGNVILATVLLRYNLSPCNPLTAWHGVQQDDVVQLAEVRVLRAASKVYELNPWWRRGKEDHGGV